MHRLTGHPRAATRRGLRRCRAFVVRRDRDWPLTCTRKGLAMSLDIEPRESEGIVILDLNKPVSCIMNSVS